jgi:Plasmid encoded RepA protein
MSDPTTAAPSSDALSRTAFAKTARLYAEMSFPAQRAAAILARTGYPREWILAEYPDLVPSEIPASSPPRGARLSTRAPTKSLQGRAPAPMPPAASTLLPAVLRQAAQPQSTPAPPTSSVISAAITDAAISFQYVPLIQCSFPHGDPGDVTTFTRRNGWLELTLATARAEIGLPYGVPARLLTIYCASEAIRTRSPEIFLGQTVNDFLRLLDIPITRGERGSKAVYANQLRRLIHCMVSVDENIRDQNGRVGLHLRNALFAEEARLWWEEEGVDRGSSLVLSHVLYDSILERSAPLATSAIRQLRKSPMDLDVYAWLVHRLFSLGKPSAMSWAQLSGQFGHSYGEVRYFRRFFLDSLKRVLKVYPEAKVKPTATGLLLLPSRPHVARAAAKSSVSSHS